MTDVYLYQSYDADPDDVRLYYAGETIGVEYGGDSARYYYMKPRVRRKNRKELLLTVKKLLEALKGV